MVNEVGPGGCLPTVGVGEELAVVSFVGDEVPVEMGGIVPVPVGVEGESSKDLKVSVSKSRGDSNFPVLWHAVVGNQQKGFEGEDQGCTCWRRTPTAALACGRRLKRVGSADGA